MLGSRSSLTFAKFEVRQNFVDKKALSFFIQEADGRSAGKKGVF
jgi:hypothetical protein